MSTETIRLIREGEHMTATSTFRRRTTTAIMIIKMMMMIMVIIILNACRTPLLQVSPKRLTMATSRHYID